MSELEQLCRTLSGVNGDATRMASELAQRTARLKAAASHAAAVAASERSHGGTQAAASLLAAAAATERAAQLLMQVAREGASFVGRHEKGGSAHRSGPAIEIEPGGSPDEQVTRSEFVGAEFRTAAGSAFFYASDPAYRSAAGDVPPSPGEYTLDLHGTPTSVQLFRPGVDKPRELDASRFAEIVRGATGWGGEPIRLFSCDTGADSGGFAQQLANELRVPVTAPTKPVWSDAHGPPIVSDPTWERIGGQLVLVPTHPPTGAWITFLPQ